MGQCLILLFTKCQKNTKTFIYSTYGKVLYIPTTCVCKLLIFQKSKSQSCSVLVYNNMFEENMWVQGAHILYTQSYKYFSEAKVKHKIVEQWNENLHILKLLCKLNCGNSNSKCVFFFYFIFWLFLVYTHSAYAG